MERYKNLGGAGVVAYEIVEGFIRVQFSDGAVYLYTDASAGSHNIEHMKRLARGGQGLNSFINTTVGDPYIQYESCFISYSSGDETLSKKVHASLQENGVGCWFAPEDLKIGEEFRPRIDEAIFAHDRLLLILSEQSIKSQWVKKEVETAFAKEAKEDRTVLFPIRVDNAVMGIDVGWPADIHRSRHIGDFTNWEDPDSYESGIDRLLRDLTAPDFRK